MSDRRKSILEAAAQCIARNGVRGLRVHDVAQQAGVSTSLLYYHFKDRDGLLAATLDHINGTSSGYRVEGAGEATAFGRLRAHLLGEIQDRDEVRANSIAWNELRASAVFEPEIAGPLARTTGVWETEIAALVEAAQHEDQVRAGLDPKATAVLLTALVEGLSGRWLTGELTTEEARARLSDAIDSLVQT